MGIEKQSSTGANYAGSFLQILDWNAKSRKKLFTTNSSYTPEQQTKQKKQCDGNLPTTRLQILDEDENAGGGPSGSIKGSSDYNSSASSSVIDDEDVVCGTKGGPPGGVVARLMGLDALPRSSLYYYDHHPDSRPTFLFSHSHSFHHASSYQTVTTTHGYCLGHVVSGQDDDAPPVGTDKATTPKPIDKFRAEVLPPKSARSIPITTHHKLLSPIKSAKPRPWGEDDAARMMEAAARIIDPARIKSSVSGRTKVLLQHRVGSSSVPLKVRNLKEKSLQKQLKQQVVLEGGSRRKAESHPVKSLGGNSTNKGGLNNHSDGSSVVVGVETKGGKSISLALLAKANVQRREGLLCLNSSKSLNNEEVFKDQSTSSLNSLVKKQQSTEIESGVLRQNNQKQNSSIIDGGKKSPSKCSTKGGAKVPSGESASARHPYVGKPATTSKVISRNSGSEIRDDNTKATSSSTGRIARKKRSMDGKSLPEKSKPIQSIRKDKNGKATSVSSADTDRQRNWEQHGDGNAGTQVISFTFRSPMARPGPDSKRCAEESGGKSFFTSGSQSSTSPSTSDVSCASKYGVKGSDALSILLEQKLKESSLKVEFSQQKSEAESSHEGEHHQSSKMSSTIEQHSTVEEDSFLDENQVVEDFSVRDSKIISRGTMLLDCRLPSPVSVLDQHFSSGDSCNSLDTTDSNSTEGSKQCSSIQMLDSCSLKTSISIELDGELSDSASSAFAGTIAKVEEDGTSKALMKNNWEPEYIKEILSNIEPMFMEYALGRSDELISPDHLFYQVGNRKLCSDKAGTIARTDDQRLIFDCVRECMDTRCKHYTCGGFKSWVKGVSSMARQKDRLAEEVYKEISDWRGVGDSMIDELVDQDMSSRHGKWFNYDREVFELGMQIESRLVNSLVREAVADMLGL